MAQIASEFQLVDLGEGISTKLVPIYTDQTEITLAYKPTWLNVSGYEQGDVISVDSGKVTLELSHADGYFRKLLNDAIILENTTAGVELQIDVMWSFESEKISLSDIADTLEMQTDENSYISGVSRTNLLVYLKKGLQYLHFASSGDLKRYETTIDDTYRVHLPIDCISPVSLYCVYDSGKLGRLYRDDRLNKGAYSPSLDDNDDIVLDDNGTWIENSGLTPEPEGRTDRYLGWNFGANKNFYYDGADNGYDNVRKVNGLSGGHISANGQYKYVKDERYFFVQNCPVDNFVIEYVSNPILNDQMKKDYGSIRVHHYFAEALEAWAYYHIVSRRRDVPQSEKERARMELRAKRKLAKRFSLDYNSIIQSLKTQRNINKH